MPRCEVDEFVPEDQTDRGTWYRTVECERSADVVLVVQHAESVFGPAGRSKWKCCTEHARLMLMPENQIPGDRIKMIPLTERGGRMGRGTT